MGCIHQNARRFKGRRAEDRLDLFRPENNAPDCDFSEKLELCCAESILAHAAISELVRPVPEGPDTCLPPEMRAASNRWRRCRQETVLDSRLPAGSGP